ncbi:DUF1292 domain-containing protein [Clostridium tarantellae]|uniref:DUF1292 domain-containing protein n=1 Tax=Clostridium tarantellae TaxID=39493 RepID=A0A6I1MHF9_9CLOT|nr:DUF1292 domain-containing protein [Clostridium tarantellae]MPQ42825.1 DUF1292 domain-containing protein [Clostridium tarantellae]
MLEEKIVSFRDEKGNKIDYEILEQKLICGSEYVAMTKVENKNIEIFKIKFDENWNESLHEVKSEKEINMFKQISNIKF